MEKERQVTKVTKDMMVREIAKVTGKELKAVREFYAAMENALADFLVQAGKDNDVMVKLFEGISVKGTYEPQKMIKSNLTGDMIKTAEKIKVKANITRSYSDKINNR